MPQGSHVVAFGVCVRNPSGLGIRALGRVCNGVTSCSESLPGKARPGAVGGAGAPAWGQPRGEAGLLGSVPRHRGGDPRPNPLPALTRPGGASRWCGSHCEIQRQPPRGDTPGGDGPGRWCPYPPHAAPALGGAPPLPWRLRPFGCAQDLGKRVDCSPEPSPHVSQTVSSACAQRGGRKGLHTQPAPGALPRARRQEGGWAGSLSQLSGSSLCTPDPSSLIFYPLCKQEGCKLGARQAGRQAMTSPWCPGLGGRCAQ